VGGVIAVELPLLTCLIVVAALVVGAVLVASRRPARRGGSLAGVRGVVTAAIPLGGFGEIRVRVAERSLRLNARADRPLALGAGVVVVEQIDESTVRVAALPALPR
jgi:membrane protein implicated in regulation of membrane protease activity